MCRAEGRRQTDREVEAEEGGGQEREEGWGGQHSGMVLRQGQVKHRILNPLLPSWLSAGVPSPSAPAIHFGPMPDRPPVHQVPAPPVPAPLVPGHQEQVRRLSWRPALHPPPVAVQGGYGTGGRKHQVLYQFLYLYLYCTCTCIVPIPYL